MPFTDTTLQMGGYYSYQHRKLQAAQVAITEPDSTVSAFEASFFFFLKTISIYIQHTLIELLNRKKVTDFSYYPLNSYRILILWFVFNDFKIWIPLHSIFCKSNAIEKCFFFKWAWIESNNNYESEIITDMVINNTFHNMLQKLITKNRNY